MSMKFTMRAKHTTFLMMSNELKWGVKQRLIHIEMCLYWKSRLTTNMLIKAFDIHRRQAGLDIAKYQDLATDNITYNPSKRCYEPTSTFKPLFIQETTSEYLQWFQLQATNITEELPYHLQGMPCELPVYQVKHSVLKAITYVIDHNKIRHGGAGAASQAFKGEKAIRLNFIDESAAPSILVPHALTKLGNQWFIRGMDLPTSAFILLEVTPIFNTEVVDLISLSSSYINRLLFKGIKAGEDDLWNEIYQITIKINPELNLSERMRLHIEECYQLTHGTLIINMRTALLDIYLSMLNEIKHSNGDSLFIYTTKNLSW